MSSNSFSLDKSIIIQAGAGAGKTTTLTKWFMKLSQDFENRNLKFPKVIITTFTRKATQELRERLMMKAMEENKPKILVNLTKKSQVHISTIHGVLSLFLSRYSDRIGLGADFKLIDDAQYKKIFKKILRKDIEGNENLLRLMDTFDLNQIESLLLKYTDSMLIYRDLKCIDDETQLQIALSALQKKVTQFQILIAEILKSSPPENWIQFFEGFSKIKLSSFENFKSQWLSVREASTAPRFMKKNPPFAEEFKIELDDHIKKIDQLVEDPSSTQEYLNKLKELNLIFEAYAQDFCNKIFTAKIQMQSITMSDLELYSLKLIRDFPEVAEVFSKEWDYWMIDEYQDTSPLQVEILKALVGNNPSFTVGDPQQSIYLFRGARTEVFSQKVQDLLTQGQDYIQMMNNYRSRESILNFINFTFSKISNSFGQMVFGSEAWKDRTTSFISSPSIRRVIGTDEESENEVELAISEIQTLLKLGQKAENICILSRKNSWLEKIAIRAYQIGVDVQIHSNSHFFERREVNEALSLLKVLLNPHDNKNLMIWLRTPWMSLSDAEIIQFSQGPSLSFWNNLIHQDEITQSAITIKFLIELIQKAKTQGVLEVFKEALLEFQIFDYCLKIDPTGRREANLWKLVHWIAEEEKRPGFNFISFVDRATLNIDLENGSEESDANPVLLPSRVHLMTVHASKGLQFDSVIVVGLGDAPQVSRSSLLTVSETKNIWSLSLINEETGVSQPSILARAEKEIFNLREIEENLRTLYVGLTRAISSISFIQPKKIQKQSWYEILDFYHPRWENSIQSGFEIETVRLQKPESVMKIKINTLSEIREPLKFTFLSSEEKKSVTSLISGPTDAKANQNSKINVNQRSEMIKIAHQGTEAHRMFEALKLHSRSRINEIWKDEIHLSMLRFICDFSDISLLKLIQEGFVEWGYIYKKNNQLIQGQIDLWGRDGSIVWIVDYKTGSSRYKDKAFEQLRLYQEALFMTEQIQKSETVKLLAIYPLEENYFIEEGLWS